LPANVRIQRARNAYEAYQGGDRSVVEELLSDDFIL
jgi:hypothetical protein